MAPRKMKADEIRLGAAPAKPRASAVAMEPRTPRPATQPAVGGNPNRLLREAAWNQMFGRIETKNPFAR
jgi:hypothetical protein